ncbi:beta galactosidase jelly roll domain-containing protein [Rubrivirga marina]|uniref:Uncharacterized protein n=1 Tax=Rubrivirga marina TaxID=1196024 RepID=A0A271J1K8_9BACT|nr:beta galactosidase jelly roll domain-containing protein [Rubrivirga marina]PAP76599.1 hypothetical protein BSZ37_09175 [Rubrivirga marina]
MNGRVVLLALILIAVVGLVVRVAASVLDRLDGWEGATHDVSWDDPWKTSPPSPDDWTTVVDLAGTWDFRIGDARRWASGGADAGWDRIAVPGAWEDEGYHGYDGFAWYRTTFTLDAKDADVLRTSPFLLLGRIDDADEVWLNGEPVGWSGRMPPKYQTAAFGFRIYRLPPALLRTDGPNVLAVRVYDEGLEGGILEGPVALAVPTARNPEGAPVVADLAGDWRFSPGDGDWAAPDLDDARWDTLRVPATWESQGYPELGHVAWYRKSVRLGADAAEADLVLVLGAIDDLDETFVNGVRVGSTGDVETGQIRGDEWQIERAYPVPASVLREGENVVAVRVIDGMIDGGIYRGPVALMTPEAYAERRRRTGDDD